MLRFVPITAALLTTIALLSPPTALAQQQAPSVAVAPFNVREARSDTRDFDGIGTAIADLLAADLQAVSGAHVLDRGPVHRASALQLRSRDGMLGRQGAVDAGRSLGARHVVFGGFSADASGNVRIDARAVNVETGAVEATERLQGRGDDLGSLVQQLAATLATGMSLSASPTAGTASSLPLHAMVDYGRALDALDTGDKARAQQLLQDVLRDHPDFAPAKAALAAAGR